MTPPTIWPARRVGDRILCGRMVDGRYVCPQGEIAKVDGRMAELPPGLVLSPPIGPGEGRHWRESTRAADQRRRGQQPVGRGTEGSYDKSTGQWGPPRRWPVPVSVSPPFTRKCPRCRVVNRVAQDTLT